MTQELPPEPDALLSHAAVTEAALPDAAVTEAALPDAAVSGAPVVTEDDPSTPTTEDVTDQVSRDMGPQPLTAVMTQLNLVNHDLVAASTEQLTHKMVARAVRGRWCTPNCRRKVARALSAAAGKQFSASQLFSY